jgi:diguanylate cyclase (GGDEF)-like protein
MHRSSSPLLAPYVVAVTALGLGVLTVLGVNLGFEGAVGSPSEFWLLAAFALFSELVPIKYARGGEKEEFTVSDTFVFAILLTEGIVPAAFTQAVSWFTADVLDRSKPLWKSAFNTAQATVALVVAGGALSWLTGASYWQEPAPFPPGDTPAVLAAGAVYFLLNSLFTESAVALAQRSRLLTGLRSDLAFQSLTEAILVALAPVVVIVADVNLLLVLLLALPVMAVHRSAHASLENARLVGELERSLAQVKEHAARIEHDALHDGLTGMPNRVLFRDRVDQALRHATRNGSRAAVFIMDLDRFKEVNDTLGHHNGDLLLQEIGKRLRETLRDSDTIARLGGDEFGVLLADLSETAGVVRLAERILAALEEPFSVEGLALDVKGSIGISLFPEHGPDAETLIQRADVAMYVAKADHTGFELYKAHRDRYSPTRLGMAGEVRRAIEGGDLELHYQPKADLRTGRTEGVEALVRWRHAERGLVPPDEFLPVAEHAGLMRPLTSAVLDMALAKCRGLTDAGFDLPVAVNLSARNLSDLHLPEEVSRLLDRWGVPARLLELEITETSIMVDATRALEVLTRLHGLGVMLSIDDFGTGYSSLAFLRSLPIGEIKIDRSFVLNMLHAENDAVIVRSTIDLGRNLGLRVVAEGVETEAVWGQLATLGCDLAQGYFIGAPMPSAELDRWLAGAPARRQDAPI